MEARARQERKLWLVDRPSPNPVVAQLPDAIPFVAPEEFERQMGTTFLARLGANESVFGASPLAIGAMQLAACQTQWYGDPTSHDLRVDLANHLGTTMESIVVASGIDGLFSHLANAFLVPGDRVITTKGSYPTFNYFIEGVGAELVQVPYREDYHVDLDAIVSSAIESGAKAVYLANPDNPSGTFHTEDAIVEFLSELPSDILVILDEAYIEYASNIKVSDPRLIRLRTFSKAYGLAGIRVGYAFGDSQMLQPLNRIRPHFEVNIVAQAGALAALQDKAHLAEVVMQTNMAKDVMQEMFEGMGMMTIPSATNFILADAGSRERAEQLVAQLREQRVFIRKPSSEPLDNFIRISAGSGEDLAVLQDALQTILSTR